MNKSIILDGENIERDIRGAAALLDNASRQLFEDGYIVEDDYLAFQQIVKMLSDDIAPRAKHLIKESFELLRKFSERSGK